MDAFTNIYFDSKTYKSCLRKEDCRLNEYINISARMLNLILTNIMQVIKGLITRWDLFEKCKEGSIGLNLI